MNALDRETIHLLFPGLKDLLNFQRRFLIKLESMAEQSWGDQSWGLPFTENVRISGIRCAHRLFIVRVITHREWNNRKKLSRLPIELTAPTTLREK